MGKIVTSTTRYSEGCPVLEELCSSLCFYEVKSTNLEMILEIVGTGLKVTLSESEAPVPRVCVTILVCVRAGRPGGQH